MSNSPQIGQSVLLHRGLSKQNSAGDGWQGTSACGAAHSYLIP